MPIYEDSYCKTPVVELGDGDIDVAQGLEDVEGSAELEPRCLLFFQRSEPMTIGSRDLALEGLTGEQIKADAVLRFTRPEAVDVVIFQLQAIRESLIRSVGASATELAATLAEYGSRTE